MAYSQRAWLAIFLAAVLCLACVAASERQPLFANQAHLTSNARDLPQRFQEMIQRRRLAQAGGYGAPAAPRYGSTPGVLSAPRYGVYGVYGR